MANQRFACTGGISDSTMYYTFASLIVIQVVIYRFFSWITIKLMNNMALDSKQTDTLQCVKLLTRGAA